MARTLEQRKKKIYTTGQIARICQVAPRTVSNWIDEGHLKGHRLPQSDDRRVHEEDLLEFLLDIGDYRAAEAVRDGSAARQGASVRVLALGVERSTIEQLEASLADHRRKVHIDSASWVVHAGALFGRHGHAVVLIDFNVSRGDAFSVANWLHQQQCRPSVAGIVPEDYDARTVAGLRQYHFAAAFRKPVPVADLKNWVLHPTCVL